MVAPFASLLNSLDPQLIENPALSSKTYKQLVKERYLITKHTHTSYNDTSSITPLERKYIFEFIMDELKKQQEAYDKLKRQADERR